MITWADNPSVKYWEVFLACSQSWSREGACLRMDTLACSSIWGSWCSFNCAEEEKVIALIRPIMTLPNT